MKKILIIEDDRVLSEELGRLLQSAGYEAERITDFSGVAAQMHKADAEILRRCFRGLKRHLTSVRFGGILK